MAKAPARHDDEDDHGQAVAAQQQEAVLQEVEVLRALYGEDAVTVSDVHLSNISKGDTTLSIDLSAHVDNDSLIQIQRRHHTNVILSIRLTSTYPATLPHRPTLSMNGISSHITSSIIDTVLFETNDEVTVGEVVLFQYVERLLTVLNAYTFDRQQEEEKEVEGKEEGHGKSSGSCVVDVIHGEPVIDRKSVFQGHACNVTSIEMINSLLDTIHAQMAGKKDQSVTHRSWAVCLPDGKAECDDDGEKHAGKIILDVLQHRVNERGVGIAVAVSRWFGGTKLGPVRFRHIASVTRDVCDAMETDRRDSSSSGTSNVVNTRRK